LYIKPSGSNCQRHGSSAGTCSKTCVGGNATEDRPITSGGEANRTSGSNGGSEGGGGTMDWMESSTGGSGDWAGARGAKGALSATPQIHPAIVVHRRKRYPTFTLRFAMRANPVRHSRCRASVEFWENLSARPQLSQLGSARSRSDHTPVFPPLTSEESGGPVQSRSLT